ncbi:hypothetical protein [Stenotrophomonas sp. AB1(2024)]|uniref:hypothetical protein n=1 Tax=Stenotrophomonas sp. AB1(2024) TaxID=3132215 RepID=UPI0030988985
MLFSLCTLVMPAVAQSQSRPVDPVTATRNVRTECGGGASQEQCNQFMRDHLAYERAMEPIRAREKAEAEQRARAAAARQRVEDEQRQIAEEKSIATRKAAYLQREAESQVAILPSVTAGTMLWSSRLQGAFLDSLDVTQGKPYSVKFFINLTETGEVYHNSVNPNRALIDPRTYLEVAQKNDSTNYCNPDFRSELTDSEVCIAPSRMTFSPALTAAGTPVASIVEMELTVSPSRHTLTAISAKPIMFPQANAPTRQWTHWYNNAGGKRTDEQAVMYATLNESRAARPGMDAGRRSAPRQDAPDIKSVKDLLNLFRK